MKTRPALDKNLDSKDFLDFYYRKEELVEFCRKNALPSSGNKTELTERISCFLDTGDIPAVAAVKKKAPLITRLDEDTVIETDLVCSETHRAFFKAHIGDRFSFNAAFQKWLKSHAGSTYRDAIAAYYQILADKKKGKTEIDRQFEYNTYIRAFFADNQGKTLTDAIRCWNYKKQFPGHHRYEKSDLAALEP